MDGKVVRVVVILVMVMVLKTPQAIPTAIKSGQ